MKEAILQILLFLSGLGYVGIALGLMVEVIPSEIVLAYCGFLIAQGKISLLGPVLAGTIGGILAQLFLYWIGLYGGRPFLERYGKYLLIQRKHVDLSEKWFLKYGNVAIFFARFIPVVRHAISIPAGLSKMPIQKFCLYTILAIIPWTILFLELGIKLKSHWEQIDTVAAVYVRPITIVAIAGIIGYFLMVKIRNRKQRHSRNI